MIGPKHTLSERMNEGMNGYDAAAAEPMHQPDIVMLLFSIAAI